MKAGIIFSGSSPILILTTYESLTHPGLVEKLFAKGISKFFAYELPVDLVKSRYGSHYKMITNDVKQSADLRVLDYNGHNVFHSFSFSDLGEPVFYECEPFDLFVPEEVGEG